MTATSGADIQRGGADRPRRPRRVSLAWILVGGVGAAVAWFVIVPYLGLPFGRVEASITPVVRLEGRSLVVEGSTTLPDGAVLDYGVTLDDRTDPSISRVTTVQNGRFAFAENLTGWPVGRASLGIGFGVGWGTSQPQRIVDRYGASGERMAGPQVWTDSGDTRLELDIPLVINPE
jgi:hypothetical protein